MFLTPVIICLKVTFLIFISNFQSHHHMKVTKYLGYLLPLLISILSFGCKDDKKPLTKEEAIAFANQVENSIANRDPDFIDRSIDIDELFKRAKIPKTKESSQVKSKLEESMKLGATIINTLSSKGSYKLLRQYEKEGTQHLLFRFYDQGKINYHDMELIRSGGKCRIADMFVYLGGENFSSTLHSIYLQFSDMAGDATDVEVWKRQVSSVRSLINDGKKREAKVLYDELPAELRSGRAFQILNLQICSGLSAGEYDAALKEFEKNFPNQSNIQLLLMDGYLIRNEYDKAIEAINRLDKEVGHDPILDFHRAMCYKLEGDGPKSRECLERLVKNMPEREEAYLELIKSYLAIGEYEKVKPLVIQFKKMGAFDQPKLNMLLERYPGYASQP